MFKVKISKYDVTMVYLLPIIIHFWLSNHFKIFRKCSWMVILLIFAKKRFFYFFEKSQIMFWRNWMRNPSYMDICCLANYPVDEVLQITSTFSENVLAWLSYLFSMVYLPPIIIHFWLSNLFNTFRKCSSMVILLIFAKKDFLFFRKISNNGLRKLDEKPKLHGYILPR